MYRLEFDIDDRYSIPFIAHNNAVINKGTSGNFNWSYAWGGFEIPYNTGEFYPNEVCG